MPKATKRVPRARATRKTAKPAQHLFRLNLTDDGREALALNELRKTADAMHTAYVCRDGDKGKAAIRAAFDASQTTREALANKADAIVERIAGDWLNCKEHRVAKRDDLLTLAVIAYNGADRHGAAQRALILEILASGGIFPSKRRGLVLRKTRRGQ